MPTDAKRQAVTDLAELLRGSSALAVADYRGLTVSEMHTVRRSLRASGVEPQDREEPAAEDRRRRGRPRPSSSRCSTARPRSPHDRRRGQPRPRLQDAFRPYKVVTLRGGLLAGQPVTPPTSSAWRPAQPRGPPRPAGGGMAAPLTGMAGVLAANLRNLVGVLNAVAEPEARDRCREACRRHRRDGAAGGRRPRGTGARPAAERRLTKAFDRFRGCRRAGGGRRGRRRPGVMRAETRPRRRDRPSDAADREQIRIKAVRLTSLTLSTRLTEGGRGRPHHGDQDPEQGPDPRGHRRHDRPRAERAGEGLRGALRRDRRGPGGPSPPPRPRAVAMAPRRPPPRSRPSSRPSSPTSARTRSSSSRPSAS